MSNLRNKLIRLAHQKPELRKDLLPLIVKGSLGDFPDAVRKMINSPSREDLYFQYDAEDDVNRFIQTLSDILADPSSRGGSSYLKLFLDYDDYGMDPNDPDYDLDGSQQKIEDEFVVGRTRFLKSLNQLAKKHKVPLTFSYEKVRIDFGKGIGDDEAYGHLTIAIRKR